MMNSNNISPFNNVAVPSVITCDIDKFQQKFSRRHSIHTSSPCCTRSDVSDSSSLGKHSNKTRQSRLSHSRFFKEGGDPSRVISRDDSFRHRRHTLMPRRYSCQGSFRILGETTITTHTNTGTTPNTNTATSRKSSKQNTDSASVLGNLSSDSERLDYLIENILHQTSEKTSSCAYSKNSDSLRSTECSTISHDGKDDVDQGEKAREISLHNELNQIREENKKLARCLAKKMQTEKELRQQVAFLQIQERRRSSMKRKKQ